MKRFIPLVLVLAAVLWGSSARAQVVLQDFTLTAGPNTTFSDTWSLSGAGDSLQPNANFSQGAGFFDFTGTTGNVPVDGASSKVEFFYGPTGLKDIGANLLLSVTAKTFATNQATSFTIFLVDANARKASVTFDVSAFNSGAYSTVTGALGFINFDPSRIDSMVISGNQTGGTARFNLSFDNISAVSAIPEPSTYAALAGVFALGLAIWRRRRVTS